MNEKIDEAIEVLARKTIRSVTDEDPNHSLSHDRALKFTQAALNLAHTKAILEAEARERDKGALAGEKKESKEHTKKQGAGS